MRALNVAIAGFGGVGKATAHLLLSRRKRYRQIYNCDVRLVAVCGSAVLPAPPAALPVAPSPPLGGGIFLSP